MAEVVAIGDFAASALAAATEGVKIADDLKIYVDRFNEAPEELNSLSNDVRFASKTLEELGNSQKSLRSSQVVKEEWYADTQSLVSDCTSVFEEIKSLLSQYQSNESDTERSGLSKRQKPRFIWGHGRIARFRTRIQHLQNNFSFRLAVFQFSSNAIDRQVKDKERGHAKVLNQLQHEQALLGLRIAYVKMNDEDSAKDDQGDDVSELSNISATAAEKSDLAPIIASPIVLPPSPARATFIKASTSTLVNATEQVSERWPKTRRQTGWSLINPLDHVSEPTSEDSSYDDAGIDIDEPSQNQAEPQVPNEARPRNSSIPAEKQESSIVMQEQLSLLTHLVQELTGRLDGQPSHRTGKVIGVTGSCDEDSPDIQTGTAEVFQFETGASKASRSENLWGRSQTARDIAQSSGAPVKHGANATRVADRDLCGIEEVAAIEIRNPVTALEANEALEDTYEEETEFGECKEPRQSDQ
jgi:hypothetical protein